MSGDFDDNNIARGHELTMAFRLERLKLEDQLLEDANAGRVIFDPEQGQCGRWVEVDERNAGSKN
jgi:hypothetical protein